MTAAQSAMTFVEHVVTTNYHLALLPDSVSRLKTHISQYITKFLSSMADDTVTHYKKFDTEWYFEAYYSGLYGPEGNWLMFVLDAMHDFFKDEKELGEMLLDIGSGPCVYSVITASSRVKVIHLSDYLESNRQVLHAWKENKRELHPDLFQYLLKKLNSTQSLSEYIDSTRNKVTAILPIDVRKHNPIAPDGQKYDVITSTFCLECTVLTKPEFEKVVQNVSSLLKENGLIFAAFDTERTYYFIEDTKYKSLYLTPQEIQNIFVKNGFKIHQFRYLYNEEPDDISDEKGYFVLIGKKTADQTKQS